MIKKIFNKKKKINKKIIIISFLIFSGLLIFFFNLKENNKNFFIIKENKSSFYIIPINKEGRLIENLDKKGLHLSDINKDHNKFTNEEKIKFSIQLFTSNDYNIITSKRKELLAIKDPTFFESNLFIASLDGILGIEFFLLYKNFENQLDALDYCSKNQFFRKNCIIVNVENF